MRTLKVNILIKESYNNVFLTLTDLRGSVILKLSQGLFKESGLSFKRSKPFFYDQIIKGLLLKLYDLGLFKIGLNRFLFKRFVLSTFVRIFGVVFEKRVNSDSVESNDFDERGFNFIYFLLEYNFTQAKESSLSKIKAGEEKSQYVDESAIEISDEELSFDFNILSRYNFLKSLYFFFYKIFVLFQKYFFINVILVLNGFFSRRLKHLIFNLASFDFINIYYLIDFLPVAHNGCRPKKMRRL